MYGHTVSFCVTIHDSLCAEELISLLPVNALFFQNCNLQVMPMLFGWVNYQNVIFGNSLNTNMHWPSYSSFIAKLI